MALRFVSFKLQPHKGGGEEGGGEHVRHSGAPAAGRRADG